MSMDSSESTQSTEAELCGVLQPLPYMQDLLVFVKENEQEVWDWFSSHRVQSEHAESVRFELLKSTYRIDRESQADWYELAESAATGLDLDVPVTLYLAQQPNGANASLAFLPDEAHIVLHGSFIEQLAEAEFMSILAHELSHMYLLHEFDGEFLILSQVLASLTHDENASSPHFASARLLSLFTEIFCDRGSLAVTNDLESVVSALVKLSTGVKAIEPKSYLAQAREIFEKTDVASSDMTHPESFIRAFALELWEKHGEESEPLIAKSIEGKLELQTLDLLAQRRVQLMTRRLIDEMMDHRWFRTEPVTAHIKLYFDDYELRDEKSDLLTSGELAGVDDDMRAYFCYVMLDMVTSDRELDELPLAVALVIAERLGIKSKFKEIARKELRLRKKQIDEIDQTKADRLQVKASAIPQEED